MAKRITSSKSDKLVEQLMPLRDDPGKVYDALAGQDVATIGEVVAQLLCIAASVKETETIKRRKLVRNCPSMPAEAFVEVVRFADRDNLDSMQLAGRYMLNVISKMETDQLALRPISEVRIRPRTLIIYGGRRTSSGPSISRKIRCQDATGMQLSFDCVLSMTRFMRLGYCESVYLDFSTLRDQRVPPYILQNTLEDEFRAKLDRLFADLTTQEILVDVLGMICRTYEVAELLTRSVQSFKTVNAVSLDADNFGRGHPESFTQDFFASLARQGVRVLDVTMPGIDIVVGPALAFGFAEPARGGRRALTGVRCANRADFLERVRKKASELDGDNSFDFEFSIMNLVADIEPAGFEQYQKYEGKWVINDLENRVTLVIEKTEETLEIKVRSSR